MKNHISVLGILLIVVSLLWLFLGLFLTIGVTLISSFLEHFISTTNYISLFETIGIFSKFIGVFFVFLSGVGFYSSVGLFNYNPTSRITSLIICILTLFSFPIGTFIGAYGIYVLINQDTVKLFNKKI